MRHLGIFTFLVLSFISIIGHAEDLVTPAPDVSSVPSATGTSLQNGAPSPTPLPSQVVPAMNASPLPTPISETKPAAVPSDPEENPNQPQWRLYVGYGVTGSGSSKYIIKDASGAALATSDDTANSSGILSLSADVRWPSRIFGFAFIGDFFAYKYSDKTPQDGEFALVVVPKLRANLGFASIWIGLGGGLAATSFGLTSTTTGTTRITLNSQSNLAGVGTLRAGIDLDLTSRLNIAVEAGITSAVGNVPGTLSNTSTGASVQFSEDVTRTVSFGLLKVGFRF